MQPWIDRKTLIDQAKEFIRKNGYFRRTNAKRISSLVEVATYNSVVAYYQDRGFNLTAKNLGPRKSFRYKIVSTGLIDNFSYFEATDLASKKPICIFHNTKIQSAHNEHLYYTPDVAVCAVNGAVTVKLKNGRRHSYVGNQQLFSFVEVKHLVPFPEALFGFTGLVLEFLPAFISRKKMIDRTGIHFSPMIVFTGVPSGHAEVIRQELSNRYGINIVYGTQKTQGRIANFSELKKYKHTNKRLHRIADKSGSR